MPGRELNGIHQAMEYLPWGNKQGLDELTGPPPINATGKHVVILGGGDTGADCLGTAIRQGAASITQLEIMPRPTGERPSSQPWPTYPMIPARISPNKVIATIVVVRPFGVGANMPIMGMNPPNVNAAAEANAAWVGRALVL